MLIINTEDYSSAIRKRYGSQNKRVQDGTFTYIENLQIKATKIVNFELFLT